MIVRRRLALLLMWLGAVSMVSGCGMTENQKKYTLIGAGTGAVVGGGMGGGVASADFSENWIGIPIWGALIR